MMSISATRSLFKASSLSRSAGALPNALRGQTRAIYTPPKLKSTKYTAVAHAQGQGRNGEVKTDGLKLQLAMPKELGGTGKGSNPEQLFALGYSACFLGALQMVAGQAKQKEKVADAIVKASVHIGEPEEIGGFGIAVDIKVKGAPEDLVKAAHEACPYSRALKLGAIVKVETD
ncbi:hypothetical protein HGRIS_002875 [Hohenbuehelia grisea]|uniref:Organic hydroperoxide resistance protein n=1 Tax=Hohenbuehelia grisea TaxID=104357 RepID=A0ABR3JNX8_9AGAR